MKMPRVKRLDEVSCFPYRDARGISKKISPSFSLARICELSLPERVIVSVARPVRAEQELFSAKSTQARLDRPLSNRVDGPDSLLHSRLPGCPVGDAVCGANFLERHGVGGRPDGIAALRPDRAVRAARPADRDDDGRGALSASLCRPNLSLSQDHPGHRRGGAGREGQAAQERLSQGVHGRYQRDDRLPGNEGRRRRQDKSAGGRASGGEFVELESRGQIEDPVSWRNRVSFLRGVLVTWQL